VKVNGLMTAGLIAINGRKVRKTIDISVGIDRRFVLPCKSGPVTSKQDTDF
jgi:hypothetical protein